MGLSTVYFALLRLYLPGKTELPTSSLLGAKPLHIGGTKGTEASLFGGQGRLPSKVVAFIGIAGMVVKLLKAVGVADVAPALVAHGKIAGAMESKGGRPSRPSGCGTPAISQRVGNRSISPTGAAARRACCWPRACRGSNLEF